MTRNELRAASSEQQSTVNVQLSASGESELQLGNNEQHVYSNILRADSSEWRGKRINNQVVTFRDLATRSEGRVKDSKQKKEFARNELSTAKKKRRRASSVIKRRAASNSEIVSTRNYK